MNAATVHDGLGTDQRGTGVNADTRPLRNQDSRLVDAFHMQAGIHTGVVQRDRDFVEVRVAAAFTQAVQSNFQLGRANKEAFDRSGSSHA